MDMALLGNKYFWKIFLTPNCWIRNERTNKDVDEFIKLILDNKEKIKDVRTDGDIYQMFFTYENYRVNLWIENKFYCYLRLQIKKQNSLRATKYDGLPCRSTCFRFYEEIHIPLINEKYGKLYRCDPLREILNSSKK